MHSLLYLQNSTTNDELSLRAELAEREAMLASDVGGPVYPAVLQQEIDEIKTMIKNIKQSNHPHEFYVVDDFTQEEIERHNVLAVAVLNDNRKICKRCGYEETVL